MFLFNLTKWNSRRDLREAYRAAEQIQTAETPRDADMLTGYAIGIIDEKVNNGKMTRATADAIEEMVIAVGEGVRRELLAERHVMEAEQENKVLQIAQFPEAAER